MALQERGGHVLGHVALDGARDDVGLMLAGGDRSEEHTSELQSRLHLVCRLLLEKKKKKYAGGQGHVSGAMSGLERGRLASTTSATTGPIPSTRMYLLCFMLRLIFLCFFFF